MSNSAIEIYESDDGSVRLDVQIDGETVWLTQPQMSTLFGRDVSVIRKHVKNIYAEGELEESATRAKIALVQNEGGRDVERTVDTFNLDVIISVGYRVKSQQGVRFRQWATGVLKEYMVKGFSLDDARLKDGRSRYFRELLQRVRDIRSSERNLYQQVTDIYATAIDYNPKSQTTRSFFATVQNKLHYAAHEHTAAEVVYERVDRDKPLVGMTSFSGDYVTREDVRIAKNYLSEKELQTLNLIVSRFLDYAELQALEERTMTMQDWIDELDREIVSTRRALLEGKGVVSHRQAIEKAEREFEAYRAREMRELESDFDRAIKQLEGGDAHGQDC
ncbi:MAG: virulence RhuM family protein [Atopobiaceae bacterium]|nr:virulence RhuM family protein [Atopobiaceae bacterium]